MFCTSRYKVTTHGLEDAHNKHNIWLLDVYDLIIQSNQQPNPFQSVKIWAIIPLMEHVQLNNYETRQLHIFFYFCLVLSVLIKQYKKSSRWDSNWFQAAFRFNSFYSPLYNKSLSMYVDESMFGWNLELTWRFFFLWNTIDLALTFLSLMSTLLPVRTIGMFSQTRTKSWNIGFYWIIIAYKYYNYLTMKYTLQL